MTQQITEHFHLSEVTESDTADEHRIDNNLPGKYYENARRTATLLETIRNILTVSKGKEVPITVNSWYRGPELNTAVGGSRTSAHRYALAVDIIAPKFGSPLDIALILQRRHVDLDFDQIIYEGRWVHVGLNPHGKAPRNSFLTKIANGYQRGIHKV